eukprot:SAG31_NODE_324_length_17691_cov_8.128126_11_plen_144_part_00
MCHSRRTARQKNTVNPLKKSIQLVSQAVSSISYRVKLVGSPLSKTQLFFRRSVSFGFALICLRCTKDFSSADFQIIAGLPLQVLINGDTFSISALHLSIKVPYFSNSGHKNEKVTSYLCLRQLRVPTSSVTLCLPQTSDGGGK